MAAAASAPASTKASGRSVIASIRRDWLDAVGGRQRLDSFHGMFGADAPAYADWPQRGSAAWSDDNPLRRQMAAEYDWGGNDLRTVDLAGGKLKLRSLSASGMRLDYRPGGMENSTLRLSVGGHGRRLGLSFVTRW